MNDLLIKFPSMDACKRWDFYDFDPLTPHQQQTLEELPEYLRKEFKANQFEYDRRIFWYCVMYQTEEEARNRLNKTRRKFGNWARF